MKVVLSHPERERVVKVDINHDNEIVIMTQGKESVVMNFKQFAQLHEDVNFYNQISPLHIKI